MMPISGTSINGCDCPTLTPVSGVLIDGDIPNIDTTQRGTWASELFVVNRNGRDSFMVGFEFSSSSFLRAVELTYFDCGRWGAGLTAVRVHSSPTFPSFTALATDLDIGALSLNDNFQNCTSLRTIIISTQRVGQFHNYFIEFSFVGSNTNPLNWLHLAEIRFSDVAPTASTATTVGEFF